MKLSTKGRYAVMAMADLAGNGREGRAVPLAEISGRQEISLSYLEQLFAKLRRGTALTGPTSRSGLVPKEGNEAPDDGVLELREPRQ